MRQASPISCFVDMPGGEIPLDEAVAHTLLPMGRNGEDQGSEDSITFGGYFQAVGRILSENGFAIPMAGVRHLLGEELEVTQVREWRVIAEKHGAFYHPARLEAITDQGTAVMAVNVALSDAGRAAAKREYALLSGLHGEFGQSFVPAAYGWGHAPCPMGREGVVEAEAFFCQWYDAYCEFHLSRNPASQMQEIVVWDNTRGHFFLTPDQAAALYEKAAAILSYYYDPATFNQIFPWHHAAGDFVVRVLENCLDVRLITVRQYEGMIEADSPDLETRVEAALYFLVNLSLHMRLDRLDGTGDLVWAEAASVYPTLRGAFKGLALRGLDKGRDRDFAQALLAISRDLPAAYWERLCFQLIGACSPQSPDRHLLLAHGREHAQALVEALSKSKMDPFFVDKGAMLL
ncbi:MAG: hypothetical protein JEZ02_00705 [Desulfatibacillum sp.]|nr:hypothetical protein [Desulfatibacillum sp.]